MYGLTAENQNLIAEKAKSKNDGCYQFRGVAYRVRNKKITHYAASGYVYEAEFGFLVEIGKYVGWTESAVKLLKTIK